MSKAGSDSLTSLVVSLSLMGCIVPVSSTGASPSRQASTLPVPGSEVLTVPDSAFQFPKPRLRGAVEPVTVCPGQTITFTASDVPASASFEIWFKDATAGGWKVGNPPSPIEVGATRIGTATSNNAGQITFPFVFTDEMEAKYPFGKQASYELWIVYPPSSGKTIIQPTVATFRHCSDRGAPSVLQPVPNPSASNHQSVDPSAVVTPSPSVLPATP